ncbi:hypothetical protein FSC37_20955 [Piscinibacter aquaticus]|uniref:Uncharacterized protein n=1 Tax=Piscinibacter aquaticus TaxID=392597 RepID=A0A5C6U585_9BURK|nr:hypothetical protein FSC37_20955 [Piscinibacter aquaticus]
MIRQRRLRAPNPEVADWPWPLRIRALGSFDVLADDRALDFGARPQKKPLDLLRLLVARGPVPLDTATVLDALWPEAEGDRAKASLDMAVLRLRKLLGHDDALRLDQGRLGLNRSPGVGRQLGLGGRAAAAVRRPVVRRCAAGAGMGRPARGIAPAVPAPLPCRGRATRERRAPARSAVRVRSRAGAGPAGRGAAPRRHPLPALPGRDSRRAARLRTLPRAAACRAGGGAGRSHPGLAGRPGRCGRRPAASLNPAFEGDRERTTVAAVSEP